MNIVVRRDLSSRGDRRPGEGSGGRGAPAAPPPPPRHPRPPLGGGPGEGSGGRGPGTAPPAATGYARRRMSESSELVELKEQVYKDPRPKEHFDHFHERTRTREPDFFYELTRIVMSLIAWVFFRV